MCISYVIVCSVWFLEQVIHEILEIINTIFKKSDFFNFHTTLLTYKIIYN